MEQTEHTIMETMTFLRYGDPLERNQQWLLNQIESAELQETAKKLSILSIQVLIEIAKDLNQNATDIANTLNVTRGGVSRIAKRLIQEDLIKEIRKKENLKEIHYQLTTKGQDIYKVQLKLIEKINYEHLKIIQSFTKEEQLTIAKYLKQISQLSIE